MGSNFLPQSYRSFVPPLSSGLSPTLRTGPRLSYPTPSTTTAGDDPDGTILAPSVSRRPSLRPPSFVKGGNWSSSNTVRQVSKRVTSRSSILVDPDVHHSVHTSVPYTIGERKIGRRLRRPGEGPTETGRRRVGLGVAPGSPFSLVRHSHSFDPFPPGSGRLEEQRDVDLYRVEDESGH